EKKERARCEACLRRLCTPKAKTGRCDVSQQVVEQWKQGGPGRKLLVNMMVSCGGDRAMFKQKLDVIESMSRKSTNTITAGWYSKEKMDKVLGWSKSRIKAAVAYCSAASRRKKHVRKDRYEKNMNEYLITEHEAATYEQINEKTLREETQISRDRVGSVDLAAPEPEGVLLDGSHSETCSDSGSEGSPKKGKKHRSGHKKQKKDEVEEERIMEASLGVPLGTMHASKIAQAAESISEVMNQLLKCQAKLELTASKLEMMNTDAAASTFG
ncbi:unnamed protein product, partial [Effrenium voratum]